MPQKTRHLLPEAYRDYIKTRKQMSVTWSALATRIVSNRILGMLCTSITRMRSPRGTGTM